MEPRRIPPQSLAAFGCSLSSGPHWNQKSMPGLGFPNSLRENASFHQLITIPLFSRKLF